MRALLCLTLLASVAVFGSAEAQQKKPAAKPAAAPAEPAPPPIFPCRTEKEVCYLGVVIGSQVAILYTNAENAQDAPPTPVDVSDAGGSKVDMSKDNGRVVMLAGTFDPKTGIKGEVVEVASPLASLAIKAQLAGGGDDAPAPAAKGGKRR